MTAFFLTRDRDAWFVIRGYKYQIDCTIVRWLSLLGDQELELECGEDIDVVNKAALKGPTDLDREVEQIKHLDQPISLRSTPCKAAIANAAQHFSNNRTLKILFRFCTNSTSTTERPAIFDDRKSGIEIWSALARHDLTEPDKTHRLEKLLVFLRQLEKPTTGVDSVTWDEFIHFVGAASLGALEQFISNFEWSLQGLGAGEMSREITRQLQAERGLCADEATIAYPRLFLHVMQVLSNSSKKTLNNQDLVNVLAMPLLGGADLETLNFVTLQLLSHADRLDQLEMASKQHDDAIEEFRRAFLAHEFGVISSPNLLTAISDISTSLPPLVNALAKREPTVARLKSLLEETDWLALYGSVGSGKTQLATLLGQHFEHIVYLSLRDLNSTEANFLLHQLFIQLSAHQHAESAMQTGLTALARNSVLILDDVPRYQVGDPLSNRLLLIADSLRTRSQHLLTVSHSPVPLEVVHRLKTATFREMLAPPLDSNDVKDLFEKYGAARDAISNSVSASFLSSTNGNPTLLTAIARNIETDKWEQLEDVSKAIATFPTTGEVIEQTMFRLLGTVEKQESRDLLYRLCVAIGEYGIDEISAVAEVLPSIPRAMETYNSLLGLWVEKRSHQLFVVCPLISAFGARELGQNVEYAVANRLGDLVFSKASVSPIDFIKGLHYLRRARNGAGLGMHVLKGLESAATLPPEWQSLLYMAVSVEGFLDDCPIVLSLLIKAKQLKLSEACGLWDDRLVSAANALIERAAPAERWAVLGYASQAMVVVAKHNLDEALRLCGIVLSSFEDVVRHRDTLLGPQDQLGKGFYDQFVGAFPWFLVADLHSPSDFTKWLNLVAAQPAVTIQHIFMSDLSRDGLRLSLDRLWMTESATAKEEQNFIPILQAYEHALSFFKDKQLRLCQALVVRSQIIVFAEHLDNLQKAADLAEAFLQADDNSDEVQFLIQDIIGRQFAYCKKRDEAIAHLSLACEIDSRTFDDIRCHTLIELSRAIGNDDMAKSRDLTQRAVAVAKRNPRELPSLNTVAALGEAAIASGFEKDYASAYSYMDEAYTLMSRDFQEQPDWKTRAVFLGNALSYFASMAASGHPPSNDFTVPPRGSLIRSNEFAPGWYDLNKYRDFDLSVPILVMFANAVGKHDRAQYWANRGIDAARKSGMLPTIRVLAGELVPGLIVEGKLEEALDCAFEASVATAASAVVDRTTPDTDIRVSRNPIDLLGTKPSADWQEAELYFLHTGTLPAVIYFGIHPDGTGTNLRSLVKDCNRRASEASNPTQFDSVAIAIRLYLSGHTTAVLHANGRDERRNNCPAAAAVSFLLASLVEGANLNHAVLHHAMIAIHISRRLGSESETARFIADQLIYFWRRAVSRQGRNFSDPSRVDAELSSLAHTTPEKKFKRMIRALIDDFGIHVPDSLRAILDWINR